MPTFRLSDESVNDYGYRILTKGIDLKRFKQNPVMLWMHKRDNLWTENPVLPIGKWENVKKDGDTLVADPFFDESDELAVKIKSKVEQDILKMTSLGIRIIEISEDPKLMLPGQTRPTVTKCELVECSIVDIGANKNAIKLYNDQLEVLSSGDQLSQLPLVNHKNENKMKLKLAWLSIIGFLGLKTETDEDKQAVLKVGAPLVQELELRRQGEGIEFNYKLLGLGGESYVSNQRDKPPSLTVYKGDKVIVSDNFRFG